MATDILRLDEAKLAHALADEDKLDEYDLDSVEEYQLDTFGDCVPRAVAELTAIALRDWGCLLQPDGQDWEVVVYALDCGYENNILIAVRPHVMSELVQLCSLTVDAGKLARDQYGRAGVELIAEVLRSVLAEANRLLAGAHTLPVPAAPGDSVGSD